MAGRKLFVEKIKPFNTDGRFIIDEIVVREAGPNFVEQCHTYIMDRVDELNVIGHVILIDAGLKAGEVSWLAEVTHPWQADVRVFNDWTSDNYAENALALSRLRTD